MAFSLAPQMPSQSHCFSIAHMDISRPVDCSTTLRSPWLRDFALSAIRVLLGKARSVTPDGLR